jgi:hypothetical protein
MIIKTDKISQQPENCENSNDSDLVQAFLKKWWVESDFKAPNLPLSLRLKVSVEVEAYIIGLSNISILSIPDDGYSRNVSCALNLISTILSLTDEPVRNSTQTIGLF